MAKKTKKPVEVLFRVDKKDKWEHLITYSNDILISDALESKELTASEVLENMETTGALNLSAIEILKILEEKNLITLTEEEIKDEE